MQRCTFIKGEAGSNMMGKQTFCKGIQLSKRIANIFQRKATKKEADTVQMKVVK